MKVVVACGLWTAVVVGGAGIAAGADMRVAESAMKRDLSALRTLIGERADVNVPLGDGASALHWATYWDDREAAELLIQSGANVNAANDYGVTPLLMACTNRSEPVIQALLAAGADPNRTGNTGETPLMRCAYTGSTAAVRALLAKGADVNARERLQQQTALMWAAGQGHAEAVQALLSAGADLGARSAVRQHFICFQVQCGHNDPNEQISRGGYTAALFAARHGDIGTVRLLLDAGASLEETGADGYSLLLLAAHSGHTELGTFLLARGADANASAQGYSALHTAVLRGDLELVQALIGRHAEVDSRITRPAPMERFTYGWMSLPISSVGATPLLLAAKYLEAAIVEALIAAGADPNLATKDGVTPLMAAAGVNVSAGGNADRRDRTLDQAEIKGVVDDEERVLKTVQALLPAKVDVNRANGKGDTALHGAAGLGLRRVYQLLVQHGAADVENRAGVTAAAMLARGDRESR